MRCILFGHTFKPYPGVGEHAGKTFDVCVECGKTKPSDIVQSERANPAGGKDRVFMLEGSVSL